MKEILYNYDNLIERDITEVVIRIKALLINNNDVILGLENNIYQFPGGHLEDEETLDECITREMKEETGIDLEVKEEPFLCISTYDNNYFGSGKKVLNSIYYYRFFTDEEPNYAETHYDELELATEFNLYYVNFALLDKFLKKCIKDGSIDPNIGREMIHVFSIYNEVYGG